MKDVQINAAGRGRAAMMRVLTVAFAAVGLLAAAATGETYYVDGEWDGPAKGTAEAPFHTLGQAREAYINGNDHTVKVAGGVYKSTNAGGRERFGKDGYDLNGKSGAWRGGYAGWREGQFDWSEESRTYPGRDAEIEDVDEQAMTIVDLEGAGSRAFSMAAYSADADFDGFVFRNSKVARDGYDGGALRVQGGMAGSTVSHCLFYNNQTTGNGGALKLSGRGGVSVHCTFINNRGRSGGGASISPGNSSQTIRGFVFRDNRAGAHGGGLFIPSYTVAIENTRFSGNRAQRFGGAVAAKGRASLSRCRLIGNRADNGGAVGFEAYSGGSFDLENCLLVGNRTDAEEGATIYAGSGRGGGAIELRFCTLADNDAGGALLAHARLAVRNCIIVGQGGGVGLRVEKGDGVVEHTAVHNFANPYDNNIQPGEEVIAQSPKFRDAANGDYRPEMDGPVVNAAADIDIDVDLAGNSRPYNDKDLGIDFGCYEVAPVPRDTILLLR